MLNLTTKAPHWASLLPAVSGRRVVYDTTVQGVYFALKEGSQLLAGQPHLSVSFAELNDQDGIRFTFELEGPPSVHSLNRMITEIELDKYSFNLHSLLDEGYFAELTGNYYHTVAALNYTQFELESKGCYGGVFRWSQEISRQGRTNHQISSTGDHMWSDSYSILNC